MARQYDNVKVWRRRLKERLVSGFGGKCAICGLSDDPVAYDFHHVDPVQKDFQLSSKIVSWARACQEAAKCVMLCVICHRKLHLGMVELPVNHERFQPDRAVV